ncbi:radical SAM protein [Ekhidna sp.]|uniref:radical SAM protein n=1 Tax=Ekhidna sp. TaxID=2608089 RepID=UPI003299EDFA
MNASHISSSIVSNKLERRWVKLRVFRQLFRVFYDKTKNLFHTVRLLREVKKTYTRIFGDQLITKIARVDNRYFWRLGAPGFPSMASYQMHKNEANHLVPTLPYSGQRSVLFAITKRCPLNCEHCFEWPNLSKSESLSQEELIDIVHKYQRFGTTQMMFSGGEPMLRVTDVHAILKSAYAGTDFWIITSGLGLDDKRAQALKSDGLTGVMVSLDHYDEESHDHFRGYSGSYQHAINALKSAKKVGLATTMALCATKEFTTHENLETYLELAKAIGVCFVQLIEPRASGRYKDQDVLLPSSQTELLESFYLTYNSEPKFKEYPIINYLGYHQRRVGCFGGGDRFFYIDTDGDAHLCPFCTGKLKNTLCNSPEQVIDTLQEHACHSYSTHEN